MKTSVKVGTKQFSGIMYLVLMLVANWNEYEYENHENILFCEMFVDQTIR